MEIIPDFDTKKELFKYLKDNKDDLIKQKKSMPVYSEAFACKNLNTSKETSTKDNKPVDTDKDILRVKVVANTANWIDSQNDVLLPNSAKKSIKERKGIIPHLHDHIHRVDAKIGVVKDIRLEQLSFKELGLKGVGDTQVIIFVTDVMKMYNETVFNQYKEGQANQHSIGLYYIKIKLAINDSDYPEEKAVFDKYINQIINKDKAIKDGYYYAVLEIRLIENSIVLFGSNEITPTLDNNVKTNEQIELYKEISNIFKEPQIEEPFSDTQSSTHKEMNILKELNKELKN